MKNNLLIAWLKQNQEQYLKPFCGRTDVVARRWSGVSKAGEAISGYSPICINWKKPAVCNKYLDPKYSCGKCDRASYRGMDAALLNEHFEGKAHLGVYPLLPDATCHFVAGDFDNHSPDTNPSNPFDDAFKVSEAASKHGLTAYAFSSRSGAGCHVYIFFDAAIKAEKARKLFTCLLLESGLDIGPRRTNSYDRMFPSQDRHSGGELGNLIGIPFQGKCLENGYTQFIELPTANPYDEQKQIEIFEKIVRVSEKQVDELVKVFETKWPVQRHVTNIGNIHSPAKTAKSFSLPDIIPTGQRNTTLFKLTSSLLGKGLSNEAIVRAVEAENQLKCNPPLPGDEVERIVEGVISRYEAGTLSGASKGYALTDVGNSERFVSQHTGHVIHNHTTKQWYLWDGMRFKVDEKCQVTQKAIATVRSIPVEAKDCNEEAKKKILKHAENSEKASRIDAMLTLSKGSPGIPVVQKNLDTDKLLINCQNGVIDLSSGDLLPHDQKYLMTKLVPAVYDKKAQCPKWLAFLDRIFAGKKDLIKYLQRVIGVCLTGEILQAIFILHGEGANGKSTFLDVIRRLLGDYAQQADFRTFLEDKNQGIREDLASLAGARFVTACESDKGKHLSEATVKQITGGDLIRARFLYANSFQFMPTFKIFLATNHRPSIDGTDHGIWRRVKLIPFDVKIPDNEKIENFAETLFEERQGILAWAVEGFLKYRSEGLQEPLEVQVATQDYKDENDPLIEFIEECCCLDEQLKVEPKDVFCAYGKYCSSNTTVKTLRKQEFYAKIRERGIKQTKSGPTWWLGIGLKPPVEIPESPDFVSDSFMHA